MEHRLGLILDIGYACRFLVGETESEDIEIRPHVFFLGRSGGERHAMLEGPFQGHLSRAHAVRFRDALHDRQLQDFSVPRVVPAERGPGFQGDAVGLAKYEQAVVVRRRIPEHLVQRRRNLCDFERVLQIGNFVVGNADGFRPSSFQDLLHSFPGFLPELLSGLVFRIRKIRKVDQVQIHVCGPQSDQGVSQRLDGFVESDRSRLLRREEHPFAENPRTFQRGSHEIVVLVIDRRIEAAPADAQPRPHRFFHDGTVTYHASARSQRHEGFLYAGSDHRGRSQRWQSRV
mmetsp:Transcript_41987/g.82319  ORF Transcript_41987/g.82319 Transcript_41987/m.82319 type:complete len:288 (-) Transcript_41987:247-1110(-)